MAADPGSRGPVLDRRSLMRAGGALAVGAGALGGAAALGIASWRGARRRHGLAEQAQTIREQSEALRDRAVVDERLRIARELHDVIAHHVAAIGVQAGAARKVMGRDPEAAAGALRTVEDSRRGRDARPARRPASRGQGNRRGRADGRGSGRRA